MISHTSRLSLLIAYVFILNCVVSVPWPQGQQGQGQHGQNGQPQGPPANNGGIPEYDTSRNGYEKMNNPPPCIEGNHDSAYTACKKLINEQCWPKMNKVKCGKDGSVRLVYTDMNGNDYIQGFSGVMALCYLEDELYAVGTTSPGHHLFMWFQNNNKYPNAFYSNETTYN